MTRRLLSVLLFVTLLLGSVQAHGVPTNWVIHKEFGVRYPLPRGWLHGAFNPISTIKTILLHPTGGRILFATELLGVDMSEKQWANWSLNYLKKRKFKLTTRSHVVVMGKPVGILYKAKRKKTVLSMLHIKHRDRGLLFTFSCTPSKVGKKDKNPTALCEKREKEFNDLLLRIVLF